MNRFDLEDFRYNNVNMTAFRLVDADNEDVQKMLYEMETLSPLGAAILNRSQVVIELNISLLISVMLIPCEKSFLTKYNDLPFQLILTQPALMYDSVFVFAKGLEKAVVGGPALKMT